MFTLGRLFSTLQGRSGTFTANGATSVVVNTPFLTPDSVIVFTVRTVGGTPAGAPYVFARTATSFTVRSVSGDTSVYNYTIMR